MTIYVANLSQKYQEKVIYENLNLQFEPNKTYAIIGPSGSGKSTILNSLARIIRPTQGQISIDNQNIWKIKEQKFFKEYLGYVFQNYALIDEKTVAYNLSLVNKNIDQQIEALSDYGLDSDLLKSKIYELSGGQAQHVSMARMALKKPKIILADEPTGALDEKTGADIIARILDLATPVTYVIIATHDPHIYNQVDVVINLEKLLAGGNNNDYEN
ncbi:ATP-binding cassette domain-containing protein [Enterococcus faecalis]|uniref:ATP-binding cassette domain-containing protein n=1 Tax=Enterococcus faecalis TaxID=1351 RepID=UPI00288FB43F|nr:ATP-binding cassette domain-containing protein [Enterococcus faecalis]MDT2227458.1 ATP-binding cassette domain-containing protein [Enterococcus faecalis]